MIELHVSSLHQRTVLVQPVWQDFRRSTLTWGLVAVNGRGRIPFKPCRCFRSEEGGGVVEKRKGTVRKKEKLDGKIGLESKSVVNEFLSAIRSVVWKFSKPSSRSQALEQLEKKLSSVAVQFARYIVTMMSTGVILLVGFQLSGGDSQMCELIWYSWLGGIIIGTMIGSNMVLEEVSRAGPRNVVITGSTRGLGKALAREFLLSGDRVVVASRSPESVDSTIKELGENLQQLSINSGSSSSKNLAQAKVVGIACDVSVPADVQKLANYAIKELGSIDIWINNAGTNKGFRPLLQFTDDDIQQIVSTNLVGSILCTREAMQMMQRQKRGGHIFNMDGAGSGGSSTPLTAVYGSTKCGLRQLQSSLLKESRRSNVGVHTASPGMVLTDLLLREEHYTPQKQIGSATGQKTALVSLSQTPWRCTQKTLGFLSSLFLWSAPSSSYLAQAAHFQAPETVPFKSKSRAPEVMKSSVVLLRSRKHMNLTSPKTRGGINSCDFCKEILCTPLTILMDANRLKSLLDQQHYKLV